MLFMLIMRLGRRPPPAAVSQHDGKGRLMRRLILLALTSGLLSACAIGPDYQRDTAADAWRLDAEAHKPALDARWWTAF